MSAMNSETKKIPGILGKNATEKQSPKPGSDNLRHKLLCAFKQAYPGIDKLTVDMILDHPEELGETTFIETIQKFTADKQKSIAKCIVDYVIPCN